MKIRILGASTTAKRSGAGNEYNAPANLLLTMQGGVVRVSVDLDSQDGHATFRLEKDEVVELIKGLKEIYNIE